MCVGEVLGDCCVKQVDGLSGGAYSGLMAENHVSGYKVKCWDGEGRHWVKTFSSNSDANEYRMRMHYNGFTVIVTEVYS